MNVDEVRRNLRRDLDLLRAPEGYLFAGLPRYRTLFGRDSLISAWQTLATDPTIAKATLQVLARYQGRRFNSRSEEEPGKILHEHRFDAESRKELPNWDFPYYGSIDSTLLYLIVAAAYAQSTGDWAFIDDMWGPIQAAYRWMTECGDKDGDGFLEYERANPHGLLHQGWKDGFEDHIRVRPPVAMIEVQGYAVAAHRAYAALAERRGGPDVGKRALAAAATLQKTLNRTFWMRDRQFYALALDGSKRLRTAITSNPAHLLLMNAVPRKRIRPVVARLFQPDMWTPYGLRTHATSEPDFVPGSYQIGSIWPHDNWFFARGLLEQGLEDEAKEVLQALLTAYEELGRMPECYAVDGGTLVDLSSSPRKDVRANPLQAWASGALLDLMSDRRLMP